MNIHFNQASIGFRPARGQHRQCMEDDEVAAAGVAYGFVDGPKRQ